MGLYVPPQKIALSKQIKKSLIASSVLAALISISGDVQAESFTYVSESNPDEKKNVLVVSNESKEFESINIEFTPYIQWDQYTVSVSDGGALTVTGDTNIHLVSNKLKDEKDTGTNTLYAVGKGSTINLQGDVTIIDHHNVKDENTQNTVGANAVYASDGASINIGSEGTKTVIWAIAKKPDVISAKENSKVTIYSTHNQIVGNFDSFSFPSLGVGSAIQGTWSGKDSYWFGDDETFGATLDVTFTQGAQWTYFEKKDINEINLDDGGIVNLYDENIQQTWKDIGLLNQWSDLANIEHDYVQIKNLKGNGGIFRLDLNAKDKTLTDLIFIDDTTDGGLHFIEPYNLSLLDSITPENTLIFAVVAKDAHDKGISFTDKMNLEGETLYDYELEINHNELKYEDVDRDEFYDSDIRVLDYEGGEKWFIQKVTLNKSSSALSMGAAGFAAYDAAIEMDRYDRRLLQTYKDEATGLWARARHGQRGVDNEYSYQLDGASIGIDQKISHNNTLGMAFSYEEGDTDFDSVRGSGDMKRYELAVYDTFKFGAPYLDLVGRVGMISSNYDTYSRTRNYKTSGDFDQRYASLSAEAGYTLMDDAGVFIEPQVQVQIAYLDGYDYSSDRNMDVDVDSDVVVLSRLGVRAGKHFESSTLSGEIYGRTDIYHQFTDGQDAVFSTPDREMHETWGNNKTFASIGIGSFLKVHDSLGVQFDVEKNLGGKTEDTWLVSAQAKYMF